MKHVSSVKNRRDMSSDSKLDLNGELWTLKIRTVVFLGESVGEGLHVGEVVHVLRVVRQHGEVLWEVGDEVGVQDDVFAGAVIVSGKGVGSDVGVVDNCGAGISDGFDGGVEGGYDGFVWLLGCVDDVACNADALPAQAGECAGGDVVGGGVPWLRQGVVVVRVLTGDGLKDVGRIFDGPRHWAHGILALADGDDQRPGGEAYGGLDSYEIAHLAGAQDTARCFRSKGSECETDC